MTEVAICKETDVLPDSPKNLVPSFVAAERQHYFFILRFHAKEMMDRIREHIKVSSVTGMGQLRFHHPDLHAVLIPGRAVTDAKIFEVRRQLLDSGYIIRKEIEGDGDWE